ncbi:MAG TPA: hypothetical protein VFR37_04460 [Longimicrobium sp.]|nr:hypothetical protein [Longimicrobium sp.]
MTSPEDTLARDGTAGGRDVHGFVRRLRERKLVQWALAYLAGAWLVLQLFGELRESFGWSAAAGRSVAVLPFANLSASRENEYFSDGITEDSSRRGMRVPPLTL